MGGCYSQEPNFNEYNSIFEILSKMEIENKKIAIYADKQIDEPNVALKCLSKTNSILQFLKNKPLYYIDDRLSKFKSLITNFYFHAYRNEIDEFNKTEEELQEFIFNMMDYFNGIRVTISDKEKKSLLNSNRTYSEPENDYGLSPRNNRMNTNENNIIDTYNTGYFKEKVENNDIIRLNTLEKEEFLLKNKNITANNFKSNKKLNLLYNNEGAEEEVKYCQKDGSNYLFTFESK